MMWNWSNGSVRGWGWVVMVLMLIPFWFLVVAAFVVLVRSHAWRDGRKPPGSSPVGNRESEDPVKAAAHHLVRGEIDRDEFYDRIDAVRGRSPVRSASDRPEEGASRSGPR